MAYQTINFPMRQNPPIWKADISRYQASNPDYPPVVHFDFEQYYNAGGRIIMIRSRTGVAGKDYEYDYNLEHAVIKGLLIEIYMDIKLWKDIKGQAAALLGDIAQAKKVAGDLFVGVRLDVETNDGLIPGTWVGNFDKFVLNLRDGYDGDLEVYTSASLWNKFAGKTRSDIAKRLGLHVAHYFTGINPFVIPTMRPYIPDNWALINTPVPPTWWQIDTYNQGFQLGSRGDDEIDMNLFTWGGGTYAAFKTRYGMDLPVAPTTPPTPEPEPEPMSEYAQILVDSLSVRSEPIFTNVADPNGNLFAKGMKGRKVKIALPGDVVVGYRPVIAWVWDNSLKRLP